MPTIDPRDATFEVPDPTDWQETALQGFARVESPMRCQVCKEFMTTPMITSCGHTFCSVCIRRCLANDGLCPACRTRDQELKLRPNKSMEEVIESFQEVRSSALEVARIAQIPPVPRSPKRKLRDTHSLDFDRRKTRSSICVTTQEPFERPAKILVIERNDTGSDGELVACPICSACMKMSRINSHLDTCSGELSSGKGENLFTVAPSILTNSRLQQSSSKPTPLPTLNYSLLNDINLRKKLKDLGISSTGSRYILERRHREWLTLWNANCDASKPHSKAELLRELDTWERTQGGQGTSRSHTLTSGGPPISSKDFDSAAWSSRHEPSYRNLIEEAERNKRQNLSRGSTSSSQPQVIANGRSADGFDTDSKKCAD